MPTIPYREALPRALVHTLGRCLGRGRAPDGPAAHALDPGHGVAFMPRGEIYALELGEGCAPVALPPVPDELASRRLDTLIGEDSECGLAAAFCANAVDPADPAQLAADLASMDEPGVAYGGQPLFRSSFEVSRASLDPSNLAGFVRRVMGEVWEAEEKLCRREVSGLPELEVTPMMAGLVAKGDIVGLLRHMCLDVRFEDLDTAIVGSADLRRICEACPGLAAEDGLPCLWEDEDYAVLAHDHVSGYIAVRPALFGPELVHGPTVMRCGDTRFSITHYCEVVDPPDSRPGDAAGGFRIVLDPSQGRAALP